MKHVLCAIILSGGVMASTLKGYASDSFLPGVYTDQHYASIYKFDKGRFQTWANLGPPMTKPSLRLVGTGTYSRAANEITLTYDTRKKETWTFKIFNGKPSLWDVGSIAYWENMKKVASSGILFRTKSSPEQIHREHPNINE